MQESFDIWALIGIEREAFRDKVAHDLTLHFPKIDVQLQNLLLYFFIRFGRKGAVSHEAFECEDAQCPNVDFLGEIVRLAEQQFGWHIFEGAHHGTGALVAALNGKTKIAQAYDAVLIDQNVFRFDVSVDNVLIVQIRDRVQQGLEDEVDETVQMNATRVLLFDV